MQAIIRCCTILLFLYPPWLYAQPHIRGTVWDRPELTQPPAHKITREDTVLSILYHGLPYHGREQEIFAYYASPGTLSGNRSQDRQLPGIVLVHGGGGAAFREWVVMWAKRGYAAIAIDLRGNGPDGKHLAQGLEEPGGETPYFRITDDLSEQWMFQSVANVILAHQLLRSFPEVDTNRMAITGISWGGVITCVVAGLDHRFRAAVPVYGCGYLWQSGRMKTQLDQLSPEHKAIWIKQYDPSRYIAQAAMPVLFVNGTNDPYFELESYAATYGPVRHKQLCIKAGMKHGHTSGWSSPEISCFINSVLRDTAPLPVIGPPVKKHGHYRARLAPGTRIVNASLYYTQDTIPLTRQWKSMEVAVERSHLNIPQLPPGATLWYLAVEDERGMYVSGELQFTGKHL